MELSFSTEIWNFGELAADLDQCGYVMTWIIEFHLHASSLRIEGILDLFLKEYLKNNSFTARGAFGMSNLNINE